MVNPALAYIPNLKHWYAYQIVYPMSLALVKASFLALYHRVFPPPTMNKVMFWGVSIFIALYTVIIILVNVSKNKTDVQLLFVLPTNINRLSSVQRTHRMHGRRRSPGIAQTVTMSLRSITQWPPSTSSRICLFSFCQSLRH
jgi:hypothetical protein